MAMTPSLIAAQEQRLRRIAELHRERRSGTLDADGAELLAWLTRLVRLDARLWT